MEVEEQIKKMKETKRLYLSWGNAFMHFRLVWLLLLIPLMNWVFMLMNKVNKGFIPKRLYELQPFNIVCFVLAFVVGYLCYELILFKRIKVMLSDIQFKKMCYELSSDNKWSLEYYSSNGMIAYGRSENESQRIVILRTANEILVNSFHDMENPRTGIWPSMNKKHLRIITKKCEELTR